MPDTIKNIEKDISLFKVSKNKLITNFRWRAIEIKRSVTKDYYLSPTRLSLKKCMDTMCDKELLLCR